MEKKGLHPPPPMLTARFRNAARPLGATKRTGMDA